MMEHTKNLRIAMNLNPQIIDGNKNMDLQCWAVAFTLSPVPDGLRHVVLPRPETKPSMRFLSVRKAPLRLRLPSDRPSRDRPCRRLVVASVHNPDITGTPTGDSHPINPCPCRAYTIASRRTRQSLAAEDGVIFSVPLTNMHV